MTGNNHDRMQAPVPGEVRASRAELLALLEALHAFFSPDSEKEPPAQEWEERLHSIIESALGQAGEAQAPVVLDLGKEELVMLTIAAGTITAPYRAGMPISPTEERSSTILSPLVEHLLTLVRQLRLAELRARCPGRSHA